MRRREEAECAELQRRKSMAERLSDQESLCAIPEYRSGELRRIPALKGESGSAG